MNQQNLSWQESFARLGKALPSRKITLKNVGDGHVLMQLLVIVLVFVVGGALLFNSLVMAKEIYVDNKLFDNYVALEDAEMKGGCEYKKFMNQCEIDILYQDQRYDQEFTFFTTDPKEYQVQIIAQKDDMSNVSTDLALEKIQGRIYFALALSLLSLVGLAWGLKMAFDFPKKRRLKSIMNDPVNQPWQLTAVEVNCSGESMEFATVVDGETRNLTIDFQKKKPLILGNIKEDTNWVLAIKAKSNDTALPLTRELASLDLNKQEKASFVAAFDREFAS